MKMNFRFSAMSLLLCAGLIFFSSCQKDDMFESGDAENLSNNSTLGARKVAFYGLSSSNEIVQFTAGKTASERDAISITGLQGNERIVAIDFRPATGQLYGVSNQSRMYAINTNSGVAVALSTTPFTPAIDGTMVGFDFNPTVDRIRLVTENEQNLRLHPETGMVVIIDGNINPGDKNITAAAYTNSFAGTSTTTLYTIDFIAGKLFKQNPPNNGTQEEIGSLNIPETGTGGFDISPDNSIAIAVVNSDRVGSDNGVANSQGKKSNFYYINLATGKATNAGVSRREIIGVAIPTKPVAYAVSYDNQLMIFNPDKISDMVSKPITGIGSGEKIFGIDMRPATGQLYALGSSNRMYTINMASGAATAVGASTFSQALNGSWFGFDFNPTVDRIRIVSNAGQNLRAHPVTGAIAFVDGGLKPGTPEVSAAAYTNNFAGATTTTLYVMDSQSDNLLIQSPPNEGNLVYVNLLSEGVAESNGFDIGGTTGAAMGIFTISDNTYLCEVSLETGTITIVSSFPDEVRGFAMGIGF